MQKSIDEGWLENAPKKSGDYDSKQVTDGTGKTITVWKIKSSAITGTKINIKTKDPAIIKD